MDGMKGEGSEGKGKRNLGTAKRICIAYVCVVCGWFGSFSVLFGMVFVFEIFLLLFVF